MSPSEELFWHLEIDLFGIAIKPYEEEALPLSAAKVKKEILSAYIYYNYFAKIQLQLVFFLLPFYHKENVKH